MLGDFLFNLTPRDEQSPGLELVHRIQRITDNLSQLQSDFTVPPGRIFHLKRYGFLMNTGGVPLFRGFRLILQERKDAVLTHILWMPGQGSSGNLNDGLLTPSGNTLAGDAVDHENFDIHIEEGCNLRGIGDWSAAAAGNTLSVFIWGILIPRGNVIV